MVSKKGETHEKVFVLLFFVILTAAMSTATFANLSGKEVLNGYELKHQFPKKPKVGDYVLRANVSYNGVNADDVKIIAEYDMPSMRGHHATRDEMKKNAKGDFLLPIHFAMRGKWEIVLSVKKDEMEILSKTISLEI